VDDAVRQAVTAIQAAQTAVTRVHLVLYDQRTYAMADRILTGEFLKKT
jgi:hypothetical protein